MKAMISMSTAGRATLLGALFLALGALAGCGGGGGSGPVTPFPPVEGDAEIRVVHASPDAPPVDVYVEGLPGPVFTLAYTQTSDSAILPAGAYNFQVYAQGADPSVDLPVFETGNLPLGAGDVITAVAAGSLDAGLGGPEGFRVLPFFEGFNAPGTSALARIVHASPDAPTVAIDLGDDGSAEYFGLERFTDTGASGIALPVGQALQVGILQDSPQERVTAFTTPALSAGDELFVIATGFLAQPIDEDDAFGLLVVGPEGTIGLLAQNPILYALHGSPDTGIVDLALMGSSDILVNDLDFSELSAPLQVPAGASYSIDVRDQTGAVALNFDTPVLAAGTTYVGIVTGYSGLGRSPGLNAVLLEEILGGAPPAGSALLLGVHASPDAGEVDVGPVDSTSGDLIPLPGWSSLMFEMTSTPPGGTEVPSSPLEVGIAATGSAEPLVVFDVDLPDQARFLAVVVGTVDIGSNPGDAGVALVAIDTDAMPWARAVLAPKTE